MSTVAKSLGISAAFAVVILLIYIWFRFNWPLWLLPLMLIGIVLLILLIRVGYTAQWTGFQGKTLWKWLQLLGVLAIPIVVAGATFLFGIQQANLANEQHENDQKIANQQHEADKQSALDQQQATTLQTYIDNIQDLLLKYNLLGDSPKPKNDSDKVRIQEVQELARARTLTALQGLDPHRKGILLKFLYEAKLIGYYDSFVHKIRSPIIILTGADFSRTDLTGADLTHTDLTDVTLTGAILDGANLTSATLDGANLTSATLTKAILVSANLTSAIFTSAILVSADLTGALLVSANLTSVNLTGANLVGITLDGANLQGSNVTQQQIDHTFSCKNTTLPTGVKCSHRSK
jgi:uncharacterized protein YjbI with pentapeptide repeats